MISGSSLISGSCLISGELSGSRLTRFDLGGAARAALHTVQSSFRFPCGQAVHTKQPCFSFLCRHGLLSRSCLSACREGKVCIPRSGFSPSRADRGCTPGSCFSVSRAGRSCTLRSGVSPSRGDTGYSPCTGVSAFRASIAYVLPLFTSARACVCAPRATTRENQSRCFVGDIFVRSETLFSQKGDSFCSLLPITHLV